MKRVLGAGLIGCGEIAEFHWQSLERIPGARIVTVHDRLADRARALAEKAGAHVSATVADLLAHPEVDVVYVLTRHDSHAQLVQEAALAGKAIFCEKPMALTVDGAQSIVRVIRESGVPLMVGFNHRWNEAVRRVRNWVRTRRGSLRSLHISFVTSPFLQGWPGQAEEGGGVFPCLGSHAIDLALYLLEQDVVRITALEARLRLTDPYLADTAGVLLQTREGVISTVLFNDHAPPAYSRYPQGEGSRLIRMEVIGDGWAVTIDDLSTVHFFEGEAHDVLSIRDIDLVERYGFVAEDAYFMECVRQGLKPRPSEEDGARVVHLLDLAMRSTRTAPVVAGTPPWS